MEFPEIQIDHTPGGNRLIKSKCGCIDDIVVTDIVGSPEIKCVEITASNNTESPNIMSTHEGESSGSSSSRNPIRNNTSSLHVENGTLDKWGKPANKSSTGGMRIAMLLLVSYGLVNFAFFGVAVDLVGFLRQVLRQGNAEAANDVSKWTGTVYIFSLVGAFLGDSYMGRYLTCFVFQIIYITGLVMLSLSTWFFLEDPSGCGDGDGLRRCAPPSRLGVAMFYLSIYMAAFGVGGYQPSLATFGADQFDESDPGERRSKQSFFCCFYLSLNAGSLFSNSVLAFYEDRGMWVMGFWSSAAAAALALALFLLGAPRYRHFAPAGNPLTRIAQVFVAAVRKRHLEEPPVDQLHEVDGDGPGAARGVRKLLHRDHLRCLDKAAAITEDDCHAAGKMNPWRLCTVTQVEEAKCVLGVIPIWICTIVYSIEFTQMSSMFVEQGALMDTGLLGGRFRIPAAAMSVFDVASVLVSVPVYRYVLIPAASWVTKNPRGITELQRMGAGLAVALLGMAAAALVEVHRLRRLVDGDRSKASAMSVLWQAPQYALVGVTEVFMNVGQLEFFNGQAPDGVKSLGSSLCMASISLGNYASIAVVNAVTSITTRRRRTGWIPVNLNCGHLDRFFLVLIALSAVDLIAFVVFALLFKGIKFEGRDEGISSHF